MLDKLFSFEGRISRTNAFILLIVSFFTHVIVATIIAMIAPPLFIVFMISFNISILSIFVRRAHDAGYSGWYAIIPIFHLLLLFFESEKNDNKWGEYGKKVIRIGDAEVFKK